MSAVLAERQQAVVVADEHTLAALPEQINAAVREANDHAGAAMQAALRAGELLTLAKAKVEHGQWESWLTANCTVAVRTAQAYIRVFRQVKELPVENRNAVALLPLRKALAAITTDPKAPPKRWVDERLCRNRDERERIAEALDKAAKSLKGLLRQAVRDNLRQKRSKVEATRKALHAAIQVIDKLLADDVSDAQPAPSPAPLALTMGASA